MNNDLNYVPSLRKEKNTYSCDPICSNVCVFNGEKSDNCQFSLKKMTTFNPNNYIIKKIKLGKCWVYVLYLCCKKRNNINNVLLEEAMRIITEHLDIINVFKKIYINETTEKFEVKNMSNECKNQLRDLPDFYH